MTQISCNLLKKALATIDSMPFNNNIFIITRTFTILQNYIHMFTLNILLLKQNKFKNLHYDNSVNPQEAYFCRLI